MPPELSKYLDAASRLLDPRYRELAPEAGDASCSIGRVKAVDAATRSVEAVVSTPSVDRYEEIVVPSAFRAFLPRFMENPVFIAGHDYHGHAAATPTVIGSWQDMRIEGDDKTGALVGRCVFAEDELAERYWRLYRDRHMRAFSVGWLTHEWEWREFALDQGVTKRIRVFTKVELIEVSAVAIPANRDALVRQANFLASAGRSQGEPVPGELRVAEGLGPDAIAKSLAPYLRDAIKQTFNAEPGGELHGLIQDILAVQAERAPGDDGTDVRHRDHAPDHDTLDALRRLAEIDAG